MKLYLYVCVFSSGVIKVGRSQDPHRRIAEHADRVSCVGLTLVDQRIFDCYIGSSESELALINKCKSSAIKTHNREWFEGLSFDQVSAWAQECAALNRPSEPSQEDPFSGITAKLLELANRLGRAENLTTFGKKYKLPYRTLQRIRAGGAPNYDTHKRLEKALTKEGL